MLSGLLFYMNLRWRLRFPGKLSKSSEMQKNGREQYIHRVNIWLSTFISSKNASFPARTLSNLSSRYGTASVQKRSGVCNCHTYCVQTFSSMFVKIFPTIFEEEEDCSEKSRWNKQNMFYLISPIPADKPRTL